MKKHILQAAAALLMGAVSAASVFAADRAPAPPAAPAKPQQAAMAKLLQQTRDYVPLFAVMRYWEAVTALGTGASSDKVQALRTEHVGALAAGQLTARQALNALALGRMKRAEAGAPQWEELTAQKAQLQASLANLQASFTYAREFDALSDAAALSATPVAEAFEPVVAAKRASADRLEMESTQRELSLVEGQLAALAEQEVATRLRETDETQALREAEARLTKAIEAVKAQGVSVLDGPAQLAAARNAESQAIAAMNQTLQELGRLRHAAVRAR